MSTTQDRWTVIERVKALGIAEQDAIALRRISLTLHRWFELECGDGNDYASWSIERDEATGKPYRCVYPHTGTRRREAIADREAGAKTRLKAIMARYRRLVPYIQTDPRGCALYLVAKKDVKGLDISSVYNRGIAIY